MHDFPIARHIRPPRLDAEAGAPAGAVGDGVRSRGRPAWTSLAAMLVFAVATLGCQDDGVRPLAVINVSDSADQILFGVASVLAPHGVRRNRLEADTAFVYNATGMYDLRVVSLTFYDENGVETSVLTADSGVYRIHTGQMEARGDVVVRSTDRKVLRTSILQYDRDRDELYTDQPFTYDTDRESIEGNGFQADPQFTNIVTDSPRGGQRGESPGTMPLPGQGP
jgi:LPS export ABC transporter protein LptC